MWNLLLFCLGFSYSFLSFFLGGVWGCIYKKKYYFFNIFPILNFIVRTSVRFMIRVRVGIVFRVRV